MGKLAILYDEQYTGPRFRYGMYHGRVQTLFGRPDGCIVGSDRPDARFPYGFTEYPFELDAETVDRYDFVPLGRVA